MESTKTYISVLSQNMESTKLYIPVLSQDSESTKTYTPVKSVPCATDKQRNFCPTSPDASIRGDSDTGKNTGYHHKTALTLEIHPHFALSRRIFVLLPEILSEQMMYDFIEGRLVDLNPISATVQAGGFGYLIHITLSTYTGLQPVQGTDAMCKLYLHHVVREDAQLFYGFADRQERLLFRLLITVSGVGAGTARMILSSLSGAELQKAIAEGNVNTLKNVKGIGLKTAQRIIVDLKDKTGLATATDDKFLIPNNTSKEEALSALVNLGFTKASVEKVLDKIIAARPAASIEEIIKEALKAGI